MQKIDKLTPEQEALFPVYVGKYVDIALSTSPIPDEDEIRDIMGLVYRCGGLVAPKELHIVGSPEAQQVLTNKLAGATGTFEIPIYGAMDSYWLAYYIYMRDELGINLPQIEGLERALVLGWMVVFDEFIVVSHKPTSIIRDDQDRLHCEDGPSVLYADGYSHYALNGITVPGKVITDIHSYTPAQIMQEGNVEVRRLMMDKYGIQKLIKDGNAKVVHKDKDKAGSMMYLYRMDIPDDEPLAVLFVHDPAHKEEDFPETAVRVAPDLNDVHEAKAQSFGMTAFEFNPIIEV